MGGRTVISPNITADHFPDQPQLKRVSPAARRQMHLGPEVEPYPEHCRKRLLATLRDDDEFRAALSKMLGGR